MSDSDNTSFCRADIVLIILLSAIGIALSGFVFFPSSGKGSKLEVRQNGETIITLPLSADSEKTITDADGNSNTFYIKNGVVTMNRADCGDRTCIRTGSISKAGESIVCLPHRLVLTIIPEDSNLDSEIPDAIVK